MRPIQQMTNSPIHLSPLPLPEDQVKKVREWLANPAFFIFTGWLATKAAMHAADAGNLMVEATDVSKLEAEKSAAEARKYLGAHEIMSQFFNRNFVPEHAQLLPKPMTEEQE